MFMTLDFIILIFSFVSIILSIYVLVELSRFSNGFSLNHKQLSLFQEGLENRFRSLDSGSRQDFQAFNLYRQSKFKKRLGNYAIINIFFLAMDAISGGISWSLYILLACGLAISLDIWNTFQTKGEDYEIAFQRWNRNHQIKQTINTVLNRWFKVFSP